MASYGHIMDLPKSKLGVDLENNFEPEYVPVRTKNQALAKLKVAAKNAERIYLAPDPDREGEAIAWHLAGALKGASRTMLRLTFNEITERAVKQALENPRELDMNLVNAQQARRVLDRLVGYKVSPFVWRTVRYGLSAGRVQSVALRLICEREDAIRAFVPVEYWTLEADLETEAGERFTARLARVGEEELEQGQIRGEGAEDRPVARQSRAREPASGASRSRRAVHPRAVRHEHAAADAFNRLGYPASAPCRSRSSTRGSRSKKGRFHHLHAHRLAASRGRGDCRDSELVSELGPECSRKSRASSRASAAPRRRTKRAANRGRAHPGIGAPHLSDEQFRLYDLIWKRASFRRRRRRVPGQTRSRSRARPRPRRTACSFAGSRSSTASTRTRSMQSRACPELHGTSPQLASEPIAPPRPGGGCNGAGRGRRRRPALEPVQSVRPEQHFTQLPPRYTDASLVKALEEENIDAPAHTRPSWHHRLARVRARDSTALRPPISAWR
jgi:DNA topoisomerase-1